MVDLISLDRRLAALEQNVSLQLGGANNSPTLQPNPGLSVSPTSQLPRPQCTARLDSANQVIATSTWTDIVFDTVEYDPCGLYVVSNGKFVAPVSGWYLAAGQIGLASDVTGVRAVAIFLNNTTFVAATSAAPAPSATPSILQVTRLLFLNAFDFITFRVFQDSGGNLNALKTALATNYTWGSLTQQA